MTALFSTMISAQSGLAVARKGFLAEYFPLSGRVNSLSQIDFLSTPVAKADVAALNTAGSISSFWAGGPTDLFAARYTGDLTVSKAGKYTFFLTSDDGSELYIDGRRIIANDGDHGARELRTTFDLGAGVHRIEVRYFENFGKQTLKLEWQGGDTGDLRKVVSGAAIVPPNEAPQSVNDTATTPAGTSVLVNVLANDRDADGDRLSMAAVAQPGNGTVTIENGQIRYVPKTGFTGEDRFGYAVSDGRGGTANGTASVSVTPNAPVADTPAAGKLGLAVSYFDLDARVSGLADVNFDATPTATSTASSLNYLQTINAFWAGGPVDMFAARYTGDLNVTKAGSYTFYLTSDDGSALYIDGRLVINNDGDHGPVEKTISLNLTSGAHDIELRYFENAGRQTLKLEWKGPDSAGVRGVISGDQLSHGEPAINPDAGTDDTVRHAGLLADYYRLPSKVTSLNQIDFNATPIHQGGVTQLNSLNTNEAFWQGGLADLFAARYTGDLNVVNGGKYTLFLTSDDGSELYVDGRKVISNDGDHGAREIKVTLDLSAGSHDIEIRYFENAGHQTLKFEWQGLDSDGQREVVSGTSLSHDGPIHAGDPGPCPDDGGAVCQCGCGTDDGMTGGDTDHDHGSDSPNGDLTLPKTAAEADAYVAKVKALPESHDHEGMEGMTPGMVKEHDALLNLVPRAEATHIAIANGDWFDPDTWYEGRIPDAGAKVLIPQGVSVTYDGESNASLFTVRVDGELSFATDTNTKMVVDTMVVSGTGRLEIGTDDNPVDAGASTKILIANNGDIDVGWDQMLLSRGIVSLGEVEIHGAEKTAFLKVADAPMKGDTTIALAEIPEGWQVGDTIVVSGTHKTGWSWDGKKQTHFASQDEEVRITKIEGGTITIDRPLTYNHDTPRADLFAYVANMTRNITVASEDGDTTAANQRGHVMFMHNDNVDVRYAAFDDLGRTDKSQDAFDIGKLTTVEPDSNIKGRYSLHFHKTGTTDQEDPAMAVGNTISGSLGWGFVQHSSNANFVDNVAFDVFGAAFAAEDGDETGIWLRNMAIRSEGIGWGDWETKEGGDVSRHDNGRTGDGFFFAGRLVEAAENVAINTTHGYVWMTRSAPTDPLSANLDHPEVAYGADSVGVNTATIQGFRDNEAFGTQIGLIVVKSGPSQNHDVRTVMDGFLNWETSEGVNITYTAHYTLMNFDLVATDNKIPIADARVGFIFGSNSFDIVVNGIKIEGFKTAVNMNQMFTFEIADSDVGNILINAQLIDNVSNYSGYDSAKYKVLTVDDLVENRLSFDLETSRNLDSVQTIFMEGTKIDSIGTTDRGFGDGRYDSGRQVLDSLQQVLPLMRKEGYYKTADGKNVFLIEDFVADRATGELLKMNHIFTLEMKDAELASLGIGYNGAIKLGGKAPTAQNDSVSAKAGYDLRLNVLANDHDPEGGLVRVDGFTDPEHGDVFLQDDGTLLYRPNLGYSGDDEFSYWAADDAGNFTKATVAIDVWDL